MESIYDTKEKTLQSEIEISKITIDKLNALIKESIDDKTLFEEKEKLYAQAISTFKTSNQNLLKENEELKKELLSVKLSINNEKKKIEDECEKEIHFLKAENENKEKQKNDYLQQISSLEKHIDGENQKYDLLSTLNEELKRQIQQLTEKAKEKEKAPLLILENENLKKEIQEKKEKIIELEQENSRLNRLLLDASPASFNKTFNKSKTIIPGYMSQKTMSEKRTSSIVKSVFGVNLKKVSGTSNVPDFLSLAKEESQKQAKQTELLFKDQLDLLTDLRKNMVCDSPKTVSSCDFNDDEIPELDFTNEETFKKAEEILLEKELKHEAEKEKRKNK